MNITTIFIPTKNLYILNRIIMHIAFVYLLFTGTLTEWMIVIAIAFLKITIGATVTLHRLLSHRSFESPKWFEYLGTIIALYGSGISSILWIAIHREHHRYPDTERDPHSPWHMGFFNIQFRNSSAMPNIKYVPDVLRSKFHTSLHQYHWAINIIFMMILLCIEPRSIVYAYLVPGLLYWHVGGFVNTINHSKFGYRNYDTNDKSVNNLIVGYIGAGEGWHNNHHHDQKNPKFGQKWYEFDLGWQIIRLIRLDKKH